MGLTTLCYLEKDDRYLMLHRIKKEVDVNKDKWIGVGGHFEKDETPEECLLREVKEETCLRSLPGVSGDWSRFFQMHGKRNICVFTRRMALKGI